MNSIRKLVRVGIALTGAVVMLAFVLTPATVLAERSPRPLPKIAHTETFEVAAPAPSPACVAARQALTSARATDHVEDMDEKPATDATEDQGERAALKALWTNAISACGPQPVAAKPTSTTVSSPSCVTARTALKNALTAERTHEISESSSGTERTPADWQEDQAEFASIKSLFKSAAIACGFSFDNR